MIFSFNKSQGHRRDVYFRYSMHLLFTHRNIETGKNEMQKKYEALFRYMTVVVHLKSAKRLNDMEN